jgi:hypothetical protein
MRRTAILLASPGPKDSPSAALAREYSRICSSICRSRHQLSVRYQRQVLLSPGQDFTKYREVEPVRGTAEELIHGITATIETLVPTPRPRVGFTVGRLLLLFDNPSQFVNPPDPLTALFLQKWIGDTLHIVFEYRRDLAVFDELHIDLVVFSRDHTLNDISPDQFNHVIVGTSDHRLPIAHSLAADHLQLSELRFRSFLAYFCNLFDKVSIQAAQCNYEKRSALIAPPLESYPCVLIHERDQVEHELASYCILFDRQWMLTRNETFYSLTKLGAYFDRSLAARYGFSCESTSPLMSALPGALRMAPNGQKWLFRRSAPSPALLHFSKLASYSSPLILFTKSTFDSSVARDIFLPILGGFGHPLIPQDLYRKIDEAIKRLFSQIEKRDLSFLPPEFRPLSFIEGADRLLLEIDGVMKMFEQASAEHKSLYRAFLVQKQLFRTATGRRD